jgi:serpin B
VAGALAALAVGAAQGTAVARALEAALGAGAESWAGAYAREAGAEPGTCLKIATSLWHTGVVRPLFVDALRALGAYCAPLAGVGPINEWVGAATEGNIQHLLASLPPSTACVVVNAVFFRAPWTTPFEPTLSRAGVFHAWTGPGACTLMLSTGPLMVARGSGCVSVALPHGTSRRFVTAVVLPDDAGPGALDAALVAPPPLSAHVKTEGDLLLPRFRADFGPVDLAGVLRDMGLGPIFDPAATAVGLAPIGDGITVSHVVHKVTWAVDEEGATATAATALVPTFSLPRARLRVTVDRPFGIFLLDTVASVTMFSGRIVSV